jgi:hypothetical protein
MPHYHSNDHVHAQDEEESPHGPSYHPPLGFQPYAMHDLLFYVELAPRVEPGLQLTTERLLKAIPDTYQISLYVNTDDLVSVPIVDLRPFAAYAQSKVAQTEELQAEAAQMEELQAQEVKPPSALFCVRTDTLNVAGLYQELYKLQVSNEKLGALGIPLEVDEEGKRIRLGTLQHVFPNWFNGAAFHNGIGSHGPGGPPRPVRDPDAVKHLKFDYSAEIRDDGKPSFKSQITSATVQDVKDADDKVVVYILDTLPSVLRLQGALPTWPLLGLHYKSILTPTTTPKFNDPNVYETEKATYHYVEATGQNFSALHDPSHGNYATGYHHYDSSDHGLFVAGIVHMIAPTVPLHVIQIMDDYGVGTFLNFAAGLRTVADIHQRYHANAQAIVNCSFTFAIPMNEHNDAAPDYDLREYERSHQGFEAQMRGFTTALQAVLGLDMVVLAAAGNDSTREAINPATGTPFDPKESRYPAQFETVYGVGALKSDRVTTAVYSNDADNPSIKGVYVVGGDYADQATWIINAQGTVDYADSGSGLISLFTGNLNIEMAHSHLPAPGCLSRILGVLRILLLWILALLRIRPRIIAQPVYQPEIFINPTGYAEWKGTSFATPVVAGTVAQLCTDGVNPLKAAAALNKLYGYRKGGRDKTNLDVVFQVR